MSKPLIEVDELIAYLYQGPLESPPWQSFLRSLRLRTNCESAAITLRPARVGAVPVVIYDNLRKFEVNLPEIDFLERVRLTQLDPLACALVNPGDIFTLDEVISREQLECNEYYRKLLKPRGIEYLLGMCIGEPTGWRCHVGLGNTSDRRNFGTSDKAFLIELRPHLERSLEIYARLKRHALEKQIFEQTLDRLTIGAFILDGTGNVIDTNKVAQEMMQQNYGIRVINHRIALARLDDSSHLRNMIEQALVRRENPQAGPYIDVLRIETPSTIDLDILVRTIADADPHHGDVNPSVIVYVGDIRQQRPVQERLVARLFGLTPSEASLATLLASGMTLAEIAAKLNLAESTIRGHTKGLFGKVGVSRQADLVRLVLKSVALLG